MNVTARALVNAAGPWAGEVLWTRSVTIEVKISVRQGKPHYRARLYEGEQNYVLQNDDRASSSSCL